MTTENQIDCPALHKRSSCYPFGDRVPRTVRMLKTVTADPMPGIGLAYIKGDAPVAKAGQIYPVWTNSHGAVTAVMEDGTRLGLRPEEFEVESWRQLATEPAAQPHPEPIAWMVGTAFWWTKEEAERDAAETGLPIVGLGPMTDTAEVERLESRVKTQRESIRSHVQEVDRLRVLEIKYGLKIEERNDLLRKCLEWITSARDGVLYPIARDFEGVVGRNAEGLGQATPALIDAIDDALSDSAEPSAHAWTCQPCKIEQPTDRPCDLCDGKTELKALQP